MNKDLTIRTLSQVLLDLYLAVTRSGEVTPERSTARELLTELGYFRSNGQRTEAGRELQEGE